MSYASRIKTAIGLLVCFGLASTFLMLYRAAGDLRGQALGRDELTLFGTRLEAIRHDLPRYGVVGYVADPPNERGTMPFTQELVWTRYFLVPLVVLPNSQLPHSQHNLVIGNFHKPPPTKLLSEWHLVLMKDYGNGMMLFMN
jgi:hypothetical protein